MKHGILIIGLLTLFAAGCDPQGRGFALPSGDADQGKANFQSLGCVSCHSVQGEPAGETTRKTHVVLGGLTSQVKSYGDLVTSVINPSHRIARAAFGEASDEEGQSTMTLYNDVMTVQQLVDLVTYLQTTYKVVPPPTYYPSYL